MINPTVINKVKNTHDNYKLKKKESTLDQNDKIIQNNIDEQNIILKSIFFLSFIIIIFFVWLRQNNYLTPTGGVTKQLLKKISYEKTTKTPTKMFDQFFFTCEFSDNLAKYIDQKLKKANKKLSKSSSYIYFQCCIATLVSSNQTIRQIINKKDLSNLKIYINLCYGDGVKNHDCDRMVLFEFPLNLLKYSSVNEWDNKVFLFNRFETTDKLKKIIKKKILKDLKQTLNLNDISDRINNEDIVINSDFYEKFDCNHLQLKDKVEIILR